MPICAPIHVTFLKWKSSNKKYNVKNESSYLVLSFKTIHIFLCNLVDDPFWICSSSLHIFIPEIIYFGNLLLYITLLNLEYTVNQYVVLFPHIISFCSLSGLIWVVRWMNSCSFLWMWWCEEKNQNSLISYSLLQYGTSILLYFYVIYVYYSFTFMSIFHYTVQIVSCQSNTVCVLQHCRKLNLLDPSSYFTYNQVFNIQKICRVLTLCLYVLYNPGGECTVQYAPSPYT